MAITEIEYALFTNLKEAKILPEKPHVLEFGENNWYGDVPVAQLLHDIENSSRNDRQELAEKLKEIVAEKEKHPWINFDLAKIFWEFFVDYESLTAIDMGGPNAHKFDLNYPVIMDRQFDITANFGTSEHIFNVAQFFATVHDLTAPGGIMLHAFPFTGWIDHGFYNFQPTFIWDLAAQMRYDIISFIYAEMQPLKILNIRSREDVVRMAKNKEFGNNGLLYTALRKTEENEFLPIIQGYYGNIVSEEVKKAWLELR